MVKNRKKQKYYELLLWFYQLLHTKLILPNLLPIYKVKCYQLFSTAWLNFPISHFLFNAATHEVKHWPNNKE